METNDMSTGTEQPELSIGERQRRLIEASDRYLRGEMSAREFREAEQRYMTDYRAATVELARRAMTRVSEPKVRVA
jgi:hypothetical protein